MKRFWLFQFDSYYPEGGINDLINSYDTCEEAINVARTKKIVDSDWYQVMDSVEGQLVACGRL